RTPNPRLLARVVSGGKIAEGRRRPGDRRAFRNVEIEDIGTAGRRACHVAALVAAQFDLAVDHVLPDRLLVAEKVCWRQLPKIGVGVRCDARRDRYLSGERLAADEERVGGVSELDPLDLAAQIDLVPGVTVGNLIHARGEERRTDTLNMLHL